MEPIITVLPWLKKGGAYTPPRYWVQQQAPRKQVWVHLPQPLPLKSVSAGWLGNSQP